MNPIGDARGFVSGVPLARNGVVRDWSLHQRPLTKRSVCRPGASRRALKHGSRGCRGVDATEPHPRVSCAPPLKR